MSIERMREELKMARQRTAFLSAQLDSALISPFNSDLYLVCILNSDLREIVTGAPAAR